MAQKRGTYQISIDATLTHPGMVLYTNEMPTRAHLQEFMDLQPNLGEKRMFVIRRWCFILNDRYMTDHCLVVRRTAKAA
jgi:hypothetical protein